MPRRKKSSSVKVNFKGVESRQTPPVGDYKFKVLEAVSGTSANKNDQIEVTAEIIEGKNKGFKGYLYFPLQENSLWKLHAFLTALGQEVPEEEMDIDLSELVDEEFVGVLTHETYNGRKRAKLTDFDSIDNYSGKDSDDDDDDKKSSKKSSKKDGGKKSKKISRSDVEDMDEDDLEKLVEEHELEDDDGDDLDLDDFKKIGKKREAVIEALEREDLLEDDDDEGDKKSKKSKKSKDDEDADDDKKSSKSKKDKKPKKYDRDDIEDMDEDELEELIEKHELTDDDGDELDLDDFKNLKKKREAVISALDDEDLLEDE